MSAERGGFANAYELASVMLEILDLNGDYGLLSWLALLLRYREFDATDPLAFETKAYLLENFFVDVFCCDAILGYRACRFAAFSNTSSEGKTLTRRRRKQWSA